MNLSGSEMVRLKNKLFEHLDQANIADSLNAAKLLIDIQSMEIVPSSME